MGQLQLGDLPRHWGQILALSSQVEKLDETSDQVGGHFTDRQFDQVQPAGTRVYYNAYSYLQSGAEHIDALQSLLEHHGATPRVPWTLVRSIYEAGFWACWLLEPDDGLERRRRGLRVEVRGMRERSKFYDDMLRTDPDQRASIAVDHDRHEKTYRSEAEKLGLTWGQVNEPILVTRELDKLSAQQSMEKDLQGPSVAIWRSLSGMQHGLVYAFVLNSDSTLETKIAGGQRARMSINDNAFVASCTSANLLLLRGMELMIRRSTTVAR